MGEMYPCPVLFILVLIPFICNGFPENGCNVVPKDPNVEVGSTIEITCHSSCVPRGKIYWTLNNRRIHESLSKKTDNSHAVLSLRNITSPVATVQCHSAATQQVLGGTTIRAYSKPSKVFCMLHYENKPMGGVPNVFTCSWEHQVDSSWNINYTVLCSSASSPDQREICDSHETTCTAAYRKVAIYFNQDYNVTVRARSTAWEAFSDSYEFTPLEILKITQPMLNVSTVSDHLLAEWKILSRVSSHQYRCQVKYSKDINKGAPEWILNKTLKSSLDKAEIKIKDVASCRNYTMAVRCALNGGPWSDWSQEKSLLTKLNRRDFKSHLWRKVAEVEEDGVRKVHTMWTEIPSTCQDTFTYTIQQTPYSEPGVYNLGTLCGGSVCDVNRDAHRINLRIFHNEFLFVEDSVYVPAVGENLPQVTDIQTSTLKGAILVSWKAPVQAVDGYMIDYTHNGNQYYWKQGEDTNATLLDLLDKKPYNITVTPLFDNKTGLATQALHVCSRIGDPGNVTIVNVQAKDKSALVSWKVKSQVCGGFVVNYTIFYDTLKGPRRSITVDATVQEVSLKDLDPETQYSIYVKAAALTGTAESRERFFKTKRFDPRLSTVLSICGGILIVLVLSLGLCCAVQWNRFKEKPVPDPGHSSLVLWAQKSHEKPFHNPSESSCERVYTEETQKTPTAHLPTSFTDNPASDHTELCTDLITILAPGTHSEVRPVETQHPSSPEESTQLLCSESSPSSPYRSQATVGTPTQRSKQDKSAPGKRQEKTPPLTVYITLDMFEGQDR